MNGLFLALQCCGFTPWVRKRQAYEPGVQLRGRQAYETGVQIGHRDVAFTLDAIAERRRPSGPGVSVGRKIDRKKRREKLRLTIGARDRTSDKAKSWEDTGGAKIEGQLSEIVSELIIAGEAYYRAGLPRSKSEEGCCRAASSSSAYGAFSSSSTRRDTDAINAGTTQPGTTTRRYC